MESAGTRGQAVDFANEMKQNRHDCRAGASRAKPTQR